LAILNFWFLCVGGGVLRFSTPRYRKTRSNFGCFLGFYAIPGILGVDIIYWVWVWYVD